MSEEKYSYPETLRKNEEHWPNDLGKNYSRRRIVAIITYYLSAVQRASGRENKKEIVQEMFDFLVDNREFIQEGPTKLRSTLQNKMFEFSLYDKLRLEDHYFKIFGHYMPSNEAIIQRMSNP